MPTIGLISLGCTNILNTDGYLTFSVVCEAGAPRSHRSLFEDEVAHVKGVMVHLGSKALVPGKDSWWNAADLIDWEAFDARRQVKPKIEDVCIFKGNVIPEVKLLASALMKASPLRMLWFLTDYQFTQNAPKKFEAITLAQFTSLLEENSIRFNSLYKISSPP